MRHAALVSIVALVIHGSRGDGDFHYWGCLSGRSVAIKAARLNSDEIVDVTASIASSFPISAADCADACSSAAAFYALSAARSCLCVITEDAERFQVQAQDLSGSCADYGAGDACPSGYGGDYAVLCQPDSTSCAALSFYLGSDPSWFDNGSTDTWEEWMNYFPKCVAGDVIDAAFVDRTEAVPVGEVDVVAYCVDESSASSKYVIIGQNTGGSFECLYASNVDVFRPEYGISVAKTCNVSCSSLYLNVTENILFHSFDRSYQLISLSII